MIRPASFRSEQQSPSDCSDISTTHTPVYVAGDPANAAVSPFGTIFGRPVVITEHCQAARTTGDIILADFSQYLIGGKAGRTGPAMDKSIHLRFDYDEVAFRAVMRYPKNDACCRKAA